jgi:1-deoxy-D-xylulose-5-phosphate reductoisomerase
VAVQAFLDGRLRFPEIARVNARVLERRPGLDGSIAALLESDRRARELARRAIEEHAAVQGAPRSA